MTSILTMMLGFIGFITYKLVNYNVSGKSNKKTPVKFDIVYWISDRNNWNDAMLGCILFGIFAANKEAVFTMFPDNFLLAALLPFKDNEFLYIAIGFLMSYFIKLLRNLLIWINSKVV